MVSAMLKLREFRDSLSAAERPVAEYLLDHPEVAAELTIHELSKRTYSSPSTIIRLCRRLGFDGYKDFRRAVVYEAVIRERNHGEEFQDITQTDGLEDIIEKITYKNIMALEETKNLLDPEVLERCVTLIAQSDKILLFGIGASQVVAQDTYLKFLRVNKPCITNYDWHSQLLQARNATPSDCAIVFSYSGETVEMIECMKALRESGTPVIAVTRCVPSPVAALADYKLYTTANETVFRSGAMSSRMSQLNIIDILYTAYAIRFYENCMERFTKTHIVKPKVYFDPPQGGGPAA